MSAHRPRNSADCKRVDLHRPRSPSKHIPTIRCLSMLPGSLISGDGSGTVSEPALTPRRPAPPIWRTFAWRVQAELAVDYYDLRAQDSLKKLYDATVTAYQQSVDLTQSQYAAGLSSDEAVAQAEAQLKAAQAQDTNLGILRAQYEHAIAVLIGQSPSTFLAASG